MFSFREIFPDGFILFSPLFFFSIINCCFSVAGVLLGFALRTLLRATSI